MADFSISDVAFTGFRVIRSRPKAFAIWTVAYFIFSLPALILLSRDMSAIMRQMAPGGAAAPAQLNALYAQMMPHILLSSLLNLFIYPILYAAMNRAILRPNEDRFGYLRLGADELRQFGVILLYVVTMIAAYLAFVLLVITTTLVSSMLGPLKFLSVIAFVAAFCGFIFVGVRLCLGSPLTFATGRVNLYGSWKLTQGRFWPLLGTAGLVLAITIGLELLAAIVSGAMAFASGGRLGLADMLKPGAAAFGGYLTPGHLIVHVVSSVIFAAFIPLWLTPPAAIYQSLTAKPGQAPDGASLDEVFS